MCLPSTITDWCENNNPLLVFRYKFITHEQDDDIDPFMSLAEQVSRRVNITHICPIVIALSLCSLYFFSCRAFCIPTLCLVLIYRRENERM